METTTEAWLEVSDGRILPLDGVCSIGRSSTNMLVCEADEAVSRNHALISHMDSGGYWLLDMGSSNGTLLNGMLLVQPTRLGHGDQITVGGRTMIFRVEQTERPKFTLAGSTLVNVRVAKHWFMVADIEGFTPMSRRLGTAELAHAVGQWFARTREIVQACGGVIHKYLGDGWLGSWNEEPGAASKVCQCLDRMVVLRNESPHKFRLVLHHGDATISGGRELLGADVNFAFLMEKLAASLGAAFLFSEVACERLALDPPAESAGKHSLKGFEDRREFYRWLG